MKCFNNMSMNRQSSHSLYCCCYIFIISKGNGECRSVIDFREWNKRTVPDRYLLPVLRDLPQSISKDNMAFSTLGFLSRFWQMELVDKSKPCKARRAMELRNSPVTFQNLITSVFAGLPETTIYAYMDHLPIASKDTPEHLPKWDEIFTHLVA